NAANRPDVAPLGGGAPPASPAFPGASASMALLTESRVADAMMDGASLDPVPEVHANAPDVDTPPRALAEEAEHEALRLDTERTWRRISPPLGPDPAGTIAACLHSRRRLEPSNPPAAVAAAARTA